MAAQACEGAFEQFKDSSILFGGKNPKGTYRSDHLNEAGARNEKDPESEMGIVDDMDDFEKESILEVKMTQLAIIELLEGPTVAVNASMELLTLFARLYGTVQQKPALNALKTADVPKSSAGTLRSIKGTIFGSRSERAGRTRPSIINSEKMPTISSRPQTARTSFTTSTTAPTIQVTSENDLDHEARRPRKSTNATRRSDSKRGSLRKRDGSGSRRRDASGGAAPRVPAVVDGESNFTLFDDAHALHDFFPFASKRFSSSAGSATPTTKTVAQTDPTLSTRAGSAALTGITVDGIKL
jgi:hypothetical protein